VPVDRENAWRWPHPTPWRPDSSPWLTVTIRRLSGEKATVQNPCSALSRTRSFLPVAAFQNHAVPHHCWWQFAVRPGKGHDLIHSRCPIRENKSLRLATSQTFAVWSRLPVTIRLASGEKAADRTEALCPLRREQFPAAHNLPTSPSGQKWRDDPLAIRGKRPLPDRVAVPIE